MFVCVHFRLPNGERVALGPGDLIGRTWTAALRLDDPGISEAHALISLRGAALKLLSLRGRFLVDGQAEREVELQPGQRVQLSRETALIVDAVTLPSSALALEGDGLPLQVLSGPCGLVLRPTARLVPGAPTEGAAWLWSTGNGWRLRVGDEPARDIGDGDKFSVGQTSYRALLVQLDQAGQASTRVEDGLDAPLRLVIWFDTTHIHRAGGPPVAITGHGARVLSELVAFAAPTPWDLVAGELWPGEDDREALRRRWDVCLVRLRARLRAGGVRPDLIRTNGGQVELHLRDGDEVEDRS